MGFGELDPQWPGFAKTRSCRWKMGKSGQLLIIKHRKELNERRMACDKISLSKYSQVVFGTSNLSVLAFVPSRVLCTVQVGFLDTAATYWP